MTKSSSRFCEKVLKSLSLDAFVFLDTKNIRYCCGFTGTDGAYIFTPQADYFLSDSRFH